MKFVSVNIEANLHFETIFPFLEREQVDVVCMQEVLEEDFDFIKEKLDMEGVFRSHGYFQSEHKRHINLSGKKYGVAIFSKKILNSGYHFYLGEEENMLESFHNIREDYEKIENCALLWVDVQNSFGQINRYITTHFPVTKEGESTPHQLSILSPFFKELDSLKEFVLCGDFNAPRGNETFKRITERYKDNIPEHYKTSIDQNLHKHKGIMFMVDGLFTTPSYTVSNVRLVDGVSDHMAVVADVEMN